MLDSSYYNSPWGDGNAYREEEEEEKGGHIGQLDF
jgi:hypothetical protein